MSEAAVARPKSATSEGENAVKKKKTTSSTSNKGGNDGPPLKIILYGAAMMVVASIVVALYLPSAAEKLKLQEQQEQQQQYQHQRQLDEERRLQEADNKKATSTPAAAAGANANDAATSDARRQKSESTRQRLSLEELTAAHSDAVHHLVEALEKGAKVSVANVRVVPNDRVVLHDFVAKSDGDTDNAAKKRALLDAQTEALLDLTHPTFDSFAAAVDIAAGASVIELPAQLQFNERTMSPTLRKGIAKLAAANPAVAAAFKNPASREFTVVLSLILAYGTRNKNQWGPWLATLPGSAAMEAASGLFLTNEDAACLTPFDLRFVGEMRQRRNDLVKLVDDMCNTDIGEANSDAAPSSDGSEKMSPEKLAKELACRTTEGQLSWAYAVFLSRQVNFHGLPSMFPIMESIPYAVNANVKPGAIHTNEKGQFVSVSLAAARAIRAGDELTFRTDVRHPSDVFFSQGYHDPRHFGPIGLMMPVAWSQAVQNITAAPQPTKAFATKDEEETYMASIAGLLQCGVRDATFTIRADGQVHDDLWRCAELDRAHQAYERDIEALNEQLDEQQQQSVEGDDEGLVKATTSSVEGFLQYLAEQRNIATPAAVHAIEATAETKQRVVELLQHEYLIAPITDDEGNTQRPVCALTDACVRRRMCRELVDHNSYIATIVEKFSAANSG